MTKNDEIIWWEKTVEYLFVLEHVQVGDLLAPLDGNHEKVGDLIFKKVDRWLLIEFKRNETSLKDEESKFGDCLEYEKAKNKLCEPSKEHHFLIFGESDGDAGLKLNTRQYFGCDYLDIKYILLCKGCKNKGLFTEYLSDLINLKKSKQNDGGSGNMSDFSSVVGLKEGKVVCSVPLNLFIEKTLDPTQKEGQGSSPGP